MIHEHTLRVYYEDTDLAGVVYYANYLKYIERARSEWVRALGINQRRLKADDGIVFAVRRLEADYMRAARFDDVLVIETRPVAITGARIVLDQTVLRDGAPIFEAQVTLVCVNEEGHAARLPAELRRKLTPALH